MFEVRTSEAKKFQRENNAHETKVHSILIKWTKKEVLMHFILIRCTGRRDESRGMEKFMLCQYYGTIRRYILLLYIITTIIKTLSQLHWGRVYENSVSPFQSIHYVCIAPKFYCIPLTSKNRSRIEIVKGLVCWFYDMNIFCSLYLVHLMGVQWSIDAML